MAPAKTEERGKDNDFNDFLTGGGGEVKSINNGEDLGDEMGDHSEPEAVAKEEGYCNRCNCPVGWKSEGFLICRMFGVLFQVGVAGLRPRGSCGGFSLFVSLGR